MRRAYRLRHRHRDTIERIHNVVPDAPVLPKLTYRDRLADAVTELCE
jgi:hypothetical protein